MDIGTSIAISSGILGIVAVIFKLFDYKKFTTTTTTTKETSDTPNVCLAHSGMMISITKIEGWMEEMSHDVKRLLIKVGE